ncbi:MBL fold metallo-hydrolase [Kitasatospora herbaricolor]|uniref:MBL fold metallo-hydrolase n=1 Tax=Kitasatospora herbaricolor TaxID=68217 RepID=UPI0036DB5702
MVDWLCATCAVEYPAGAEHPANCPICEDERQYVPPTGQVWTSLQQLASDGERIGVSELEPDLYALRSEPKVGIGQQSMLLRTPEGNLLWDPTGYVDEDAATAVRALGGVSVIATSHPHMFGAQTSWSRLVGDVPVLVHERDRQWVQREEPCIQTWSGEREVLRGVTLRTIGGHFPGSAVVHWDRGVVLSGDTVFPGPSGRWVTFQRSYPNDIPLSGAVARRVADAVCERPFDRLYGNLGNSVLQDARSAVLRSADRYVAWVTGANDHLT